MSLLLFSLFPFTATSASCGSDAEDRSVLPPVQGLEGQVVGCGDDGLVSGWDVGDSGCMEAQCRNGRAGEGCVSLNTPCIRYDTFDGLSGAPASCPEGFVVSSWQLVSASDCSKIAYRCCPAGIGATLQRHTPCANLSTQVLVVMPPLHCGEHHAVASWWLTSDGCNGPFTLKRWTYSCGPLPPLKDTPAPHTEVPSTPVPTEGEKEEAEEEEERIPRSTSRALGVASSVSVKGPAAAVLTSFVDCTVEDIDLNHSEVLDWEYHPLQFAVGSTRNRYLFGAVISNLLITGAFAFASYAAVMFQVAFFSEKYEEVVFYFRAPGMVYLPAMWLLTGTVFAGSHLIFFSEGGDTATLTAGVVTLAACASLPILLWVLLLRPSVFKARTIDDPRLDSSDLPYLSSFGELKGFKRSLYVWVFGKKVWVAERGSFNYFVEQYGLCFEQYKEGYHWFSLVEVSQVLAVALLAGWKPKGGAYECGTRNVLVTAVLGFYLITVLICSPFNAAFDFIFAVVLASTMFIAVLLMTVSITLTSSAPPVLVQIASFFLLLGAVVLFVKGVYDFFLYLLDLYVGRRRYCSSLGRVGKGSSSVQLLHESDVEAGKKEESPKGDDGESSCSYCSEPLSCGASDVGLPHSCVQMSSSFPVLPLPVLPLRELTRPQSYTAHATLLQPLLPPGPQVPVRGTGRGRSSFIQAQHYSPHPQPPYPPENQIITSQATQGTVLCSF